VNVHEASWSEMIVEECVYQRLLDRFRFWRSQGVVSSIRAVRFEQRRGLVASWMCLLAPHELSERLLLRDVQAFARESCRECGLPDATIWWIRADAVIHVRVAFSEQPFDA